MSGKSVTGLPPGLGTWEMKWGARGYWYGRHGVGQWAATRRRSADVGPSGSAGGGVGTPARRRIADLRPRSWSAGGGVGTPARRRIADLRPRGWSTGERGRNPSTAGRTDPRSRPENSRNKSKEASPCLWMKSAGTAAGWSVKICATPLAF